MGIWVLRFCGTLLVLLAACSGCGEDAAQPQGVAAPSEPNEWLTGGDTTNRYLLGRNAFLRPAQNLLPENSQDFYSGNSFFNQGWVEAPSSTQARDGLGPLFNARTCSACHFRDGKGQPPEDGQGPFVGLLLRLSVPGPSGPVPDPHYGSQLQDQANPDLPAEAIPRIEWTELEGTYGDGTPYTLLKPNYIIENQAYGAFGDNLMVSPRIAPHMVGLGLLEAIPDARLRSLADPDDEDNNGISGRLQLHQTDEGERIGRFGWKGDVPDVERQVAAAFIGDMGLTSRIHPENNCTSVQEQCQVEPTGGSPEVEDKIFDLVVLYSRAIAVPVRRRADHPDVVAGKAIFNEIGCADCHVPRHLTGPAALSEFENQWIFPYTDLLLHDMGDDLADGQPVGRASGREWKTPPLWSLGLVEAVSGHTRFLHDGRARNLTEAILWHGGEAQASKEAFKARSANERSLLITFLEDL